MSAWTMSPQAPCRSSATASSPTSPPNPKASSRMTSRARSSNPFRGTRRSLNSRRWNHEEHEGHEEMPLGDSIPEHLERIATQIVDSAFCVHKEMKAGLLESVYVTCLA